MNAGSRASNWNNAPSNSNNNIGARGVCDYPFTASALLTGARTDPFTGGQPAGRASANTILGRGAASSALRRNPQPPHFSLGTRYRNLFASIIAPANLREAYRRTSLGKRGTLGFLRFKEDAEARLYYLAKALERGDYRPAPPREFLVFDPKPRAISALSFEDRVVQHALCLVIEPIFDATLMPRCYACRRGYGTHVGVRAVQAELRRQLEYGDVYFLKTDFKAFFASIDRARLWREIERKISDRRTLELIEVFTPRAGTGLPIGNLTSQLWANVYGGVFDRWLVAQGALQWHRYMDDVVVLGGSDWRSMVSLLHQVEIFAEREMHLRLSRWMVAHHSRGINFLGYRIWSTHKLLRRSSVVRARRRLRVFDRHGDAEGRARFLGSWMGHASWADSHNLLASMGLCARN